MEDEDEDGSEMFSFGHEYRMMQRRREMER